jgi:hypothetical protein
MMTVGGCFDAETVGYAGTYKAVEQKYSSLSNTLSWDRGHTPMGYEKCRKR